MTELTECCDCGHIFPSDAAESRLTMPARRHGHPDDMTEAEYTAVCPLCDSPDLAEAVLDARDCLRLLQRTFPNRHVRVATQTQTASPTCLTVTLWLGDCRMVTKHSVNSEERLGQVFRRALENAVARFHKAVPA